MRKSYLIAVFVSAFFSGCSSDTVLPDGQPDDEAENIYLSFNRWVYSEMNRQYLWREDLPDSTACDYDLAPKEFFYSILSDKDRFSYLTFNPTYSGRSARNYGFAFQPCEDKAGNQAAYILYVTSSSARKSGLRRGDIIEFRNDGDILDISLLTMQNGILNPSGDHFELTLNDMQDKPSSVLLDTVYVVNNHAIGYLCYLEYGEVRDLTASLQRFKNERITDLILDLRYNPGGYVNTSRYLCNSIVPQAAYGGIFQQCSYNDILTEYYDRTTGAGRTYSFYEYPTDPDKETLGSQLYGLQLQRLHVITSRHTASASEATIICLRPYMEVIIIGEQTVGKGVGSWTIFDPEYDYALQAITMRYYNSLGETTPDEGLMVDYYVPDGFSSSKKDIGDTDEPLLHKALEVIAPDSFPPAETLTRTVGQGGDIPLVPVGEPSFVTEYKIKKHHYEE